LHSQMNSIIFKKLASSTENLLHQASMMTGIIEKYENDTKKQDIAIEEVKLNTRSNYNTLMSLTHGFQQINTNISSLKLS